MRCWICDVQPLAVYETTAFGDEQRTFIANWPKSDHQHAERPPTPAELEDAGARSREVIREQFL